MAVAVTLPVAPEVSKLSDERDEVVEVVADEMEDASGRSVQVGEWT